MNSEAYTEGYNAARQQTGMGNPYDQTNQKADFEDFCSGFDQGEQDRVALDQEAPAPVTD